ncbi:MAG: hypothetical protein ACT4PL_08120, partial [Phycisphaerales bacterium]
FEGEHAQEAHAENVDVPQVIAVGIAGFMIIVVAVVATVIYFNWYNDALKIQRVERGDLFDSSVPRVDHEYSEARKRLEAEQANYGWVDGSTDIVRVPVAEAKKLMAQKLAKK